MLARKYEAYELEEQAVPRRRKAKSAAVAKSKARLNRIILLGTVLLATYLAAVVRSEAMVAQGHQLLSLRKQETELAARNSELRIELERLRGPERIISLAEERLGMSVARSNIYVKAAGGENGTGAMALAGK